MKPLKVHFVASGQIPKSKPSSSRESGIRYDMSQFYSMKDVMEQLFGKRAYLRLKETASLKDWKDSTIKLLNAILLASESSIAVADDDWRNEITDVVKLGVKLISSADHISDCGDPDTNRLRSDRVYAQSPLTAKDRAAHKGMVD